MQGQRLISALGVINLPHSFHSTPVEVIVFAFRDNEFLSFCHDCQLFMVYGFIRSDLQRLQTATI